MKGISKRKTKLGFHILRLHYTADPDKDPSTPAGKKWYDEARRGMSDARWRQEYELDYGALGGQLVFSEFEESIHVVEPSFPLHRLDATVYLGADPHPRTHHAFIWLAVNAYGEKAVVWSWWKDEPSRLVSDYCRKLRVVDAYPLGLKPYRRVMDQAAKSFNASEDKDYFQAYREARDEDGKRIGIVFQPAKKNFGYVGYELIRQDLRPQMFKIDGKEFRRPTLTIWKGCGDNDELVRQLKSLRYREWKGNVTDKDPPEEPQEKRRHLVDALSYIELDKPRFIDPRMRVVDEPNDPNIVNSSQE